MLKFRYLFNNPELVWMLLKNWDFDADSEELLQYFRISANAIYPVKVNAEICYLRFSPVSEKRLENVHAELAFIHYLHGHGYLTMEIVPSKHGEEIVRRETPWGDYVASVFKRVKGRQINQTDFNHEIMFAYGSALGELHSLSSTYENAPVKRWSHLNVLDWIEVTLKAMGLDQEPIRELGFLKSEFRNIHQTQNNYGLIHFDFEPDNVFYDEGSGQCSVIDFDDAMYHWYVMDIMQALEAIRDETEKDDISDLEAQFLDGYRSKNLIDEQLFVRKELFRRFANLYQYTRVARAMQEHWENEPDWMVMLRSKLMKNYLRAQLQFPS